MAKQKLKYGTLVSLFLAAVGGTIYYEESNRQQIYARDIIEIVEGVRERELILADITKTNTIVLQIATNRQTLVELDAVIDTLITNFVNQTRIDEWLTAYPDPETPYMWTRAELWQYLQIGNWVSNGTLFTRTPALATTNNVATFGAYPYQIYKTDLDERYKVIKALTHTWSYSEWGSNNLYRATQYENYYFETNEAFGNPNTNVYPSAAELQANLLVDYKPDWVDVADNFSMNFSTFDMNESLYGNGYGQAPSALRMIRGTIYQYWFAQGWTDISLNQLMRDVLLYSHIDQRYYYATNTSVQAQIYADYGRSIPITRTDYFYDQNELFQEVAVSSNVPASHTSNFVEPPDITTNCSFYVTFEYDLENGWRTNLYVEGTLLSVDTQTNAVLSDYCSVSTNRADATMPVIHKWDVERCKD